MNFAGGVRWTLRGDDLTIQQRSVVILNKLYAASRRKHEWKVGIYNTGPYFFKNESKYETDSRSLYSSKTGKQYFYFPIVLWIKTCSQCNFLGNKKCTENFIRKSSQYLQEDACVGDLTVHIGGVCFT